MSDKVATLPTPEEMNASTEETLSKAERNFFKEIEYTLTKRQVEVLRNIAKLDQLPKSKNKFLEEIGVAKSTWWMWKEDRKFLSALNQLSLIRHTDDLLWADDSIAAKAREGDLQAAKYLREILGMKPEEPAEADTPKEVYFEGLPVGKREVKP